MRVKHASKTQPLITRTSLANDNQQEGLLRELNPGPLAPGARIMPLDQAANWFFEKTGAYYRLRRSRATRVHPSIELPLADRNT